MDAKTIGVILLLCFFLASQINLTNKLIIVTKKRNFEKITIVLGVIILSCITYFYANSVLDYIFAIVGIITLLITVHTQGIYAEGLLVNTRQAKKYLWSQIGYASIKETDDIQITYYSTIGSPLFHHRYSKKDKEKIYQILDENITIKH